MEYSKAVLEHLKAPRNKGTIENPDGLGEVGNPMCGDMMTITIRVEGERITDIAFETLGCGAAVAVSSVVTEMARGKSLEEALKINNQMVAEKLGALPKNELHCANLGTDALHKAIMDYYHRQGRRKGLRPDKRVEHVHTHEGACKCPYCDVEVPSETPYCGNCGKPILIEQK